MSQAQGVKGIYIIMTYKVYIRSSGKCGTAESAEPRESAESAEVRKTGCPLTFTPSSKTRRLDVLTATKGRHLPLKKECCRTVPH